MNREEARSFFRRKNERRRLVHDPQVRRANREMGRLLSARLFNKDKHTDSKTVRAPRKDLS